jgi:hypothetical protein
MNASNRQIEVVESDGYKRGGVSYPITIEFAAGELAGPENARMIHPDERELPLQIDVLESWPDRSIKNAEIFFPLHLPAGGSGTYTLEVGSEIAPSAKQQNPVEITGTPEELIINQGPVTYVVNKRDYNGVDSATFNRDVWKGKHPTGAEIKGPKPFLKPGSKPTFLITRDGTEIGLSEPVEIAIETEGPRTGRVRVTGQYPGNFSFTSRITFYSGVPWYRHAFSLAGDTADIASVVFEDTFDLADGPLQSAYGARVNGMGQPTSWSVVTDGVSTIDIAAHNAWSDSGYVRYESESDGCFRVIAPYTGDPIVTLYHFLITPPADHYHTPAGAMVAAPHLKLLE